MIKLQSQLNFNWKPFEEDIGIFGMKGSGKTTKATEILDLVPNIPRWIWSPQKPKENYGGYGVPVSNLEDLKHGAYLWVGDYSKSTFLKICERMEKYFRNILFVGDDIHEQVTKQFIPPEFDKLLSSGRNKGISGIYLSTSPAKVHNTILGGCSHIFGYQLNLLKQIEWFRDNYFGNQAYLLLDKDFRGNHFNRPEDPEQLPKYSYLYRKDSDRKTQVIISDMNQILDTEEPQEEIVEEVEENQTEPLNNENTEEEDIEPNTSTPEDQDNSLS